MLKLLAALAATLMLASTPAFAQQPCAPLAKVAAVLQGKYHEAPLWLGQVAANRGVLLTQSADGKTWTLMVVQDGMACLIGEGTNGHLAAPATGG